MTEKHPIFKQEDVAEYYNTTLIHYEKWWNLKKSLSLHYGIWDDETKNFRQALLNTNFHLQQLAKITKNDHVLDAGCGVGGASIFLAKSAGCKVDGITLSQKQVDYANKAAQNSKVNDKVSFYLMDYTQTSYPNDTFDVIWACESISSAPDKTAFIKEAARILKPGGRLVMSDFFYANPEAIPHKWMVKWGETWGISTFIAFDTFSKALQNSGFRNIETSDYTNKIYKSARRMYFTALMGAIPSELYNVTHPGVSRFAKTHYKCGFYQYKALQQGLWNYNIIVAYLK